MHKCDKCDSLVDPAGDKGDEKKKFPLVQSPQQHHGQQRRGTRQPVVTAESEHAHAGACKADN